MPINSFFFALRAIDIAKLGTCKKVKDALNAALLTHSKLGKGCIRFMKPKFINKDFCMTCFANQACKKMNEHDKTLELPPFLCLSCPYYK